MRKYVAAFGTLFNDIHIDRRDNTGTVVQEMKIPIHYGPFQKFLAKLEQDPNLSAPAMTLPRMSFEITGISYDSSRKLSTLNRNCAINPNDPDSKITQFVGTPYNIEFQLNVMTKYNEDGMKIVEQILPFFNPDFTPRLDLFEGSDMNVSVPIVLTGVTQEDTYEADFETRRALIWTLTFTMKGYFFGPSTNVKIIKFSEANVFNSIDPDAQGQTVTVQPGLTSNGEPTTDINETIPYADINPDDDWGYIVKIEDLNG